MEIDGRVELSGQGGWRPDTLDFPAGIPLEAEIQQVFDNVASMLTAVGLDWSNVAYVNSYHTPEAERRSWLQPPKWRANSALAPSS
jgi:enamine deaminase RidA (YjgF/YER057c/UK114 family)